MSTNLSTTRFVENSRYSGTSIRKRERSPPHVGISPEEKTNEVFHKIKKSPVVSDLPSLIPQNPNPVIEPFNLLDLAVDLSSPRSTGQASPSGSPPLIEDEATDKLPKIS
jgi:hypothetical protein